MNKVYLQGTLPFDFYLTDTTFIYVMGISKDFFNLNLVQTEEILSGKIFFVFIFIYLFKIIIKI